MHSKWWLTTALPMAAVGLVACDAGLGEPVVPGGSPGGPISGGPNGPNGPSGPNGPGGSGGSPVLPDAPVTPEPELPAKSTQLVRLTHDQWVNTVNDALGYDASALAETFRSDAGGGGLRFENRADLTVDEILWDGYRRASEEVAQAVLQNSGLRDALFADVPQAGTDSERATAFINSVGARLQRRPLSADDVNVYLQVFQVGAEQGFDAGIELALAAMLQSPLFLYRVESTGTPVNGIIALDGYEVASRLSYFLWNTMPDQALLSAASDGSLLTTEGIRTQAERMLADPRAEQVFLDFHDQLLEVYRYDRIDPNDAVFPDVTDRLPELAQEETNRFLSMLFAEAGDLRRFLTSTETFVERELASLYGLSGSFSDQFQRVTLPADQRAGYFTQVGYLASHATSVNPDIIHRGVFLTNAIACNQLNPPPDDIPPLPPAMGRTNRETVEQHTEQEGSSCIVCHGGLINPFGFPFESYDAVGQLRTTDNGFPVDTTAAPILDGEPVPVSDAVELAQELAASNGVHACYAKHWIEFAFGRIQQTEDGPLIDRLAQNSMGGASIRALILDVVTSQPFRTRAE
ncbi:MAG: DUF1592 domain-containing protein [Myxococcota bacterium]